MFSRRLRWGAAAAVVVDIRALPTDVAYGWGVWAGMRRLRTLRPIMPRLISLAGPQHRAQLRSSDVRLTIRTALWRSHVASVASSVDGLVPVVKGNGYGFGRRWLAETAAEFSDTIAVGTIHELEDLPGAVTPVVLTPTLTPPATRRPRRISPGRSSPSATRPTSTRSPDGTVASS